MLKNLTVASLASTCSLYWNESSPLLTDRASHDFGEFDLATVIGVQPVIAQVLLGIHPESWWSLRAKEYKPADNCVRNQF